MMFETIIMIAIVVDLILLVLAIVSETGKRRTMDEREYIKLDKKPDDLLAYITRLKSQRDALKTELSKTKEELAAYRWIPVTEDLPEEGVEVLALLEGKMWLEYIGDDKMGRTKESFAKVFTHWMKKPSLPEGEE